MSPIFIILLAIGSVYGQNCRALVFPDGNDYVYFQAGAASTLIQLNEYDVIVAQGFASLIAIQIAQGITPNNLVQYWRQFSSKDVLQEWEFGLIEGLVNKPSFYNSSILFNTVSKLIDSAPLKKRFRILSTDINTGAPFYVTETSDRETLIAGVVASASQPLFFTPVKLGDKKLVIYKYNNELAGTLITQADFQSGISLCKEISGGEARVTVDSVFVTEESVRIKETGSYKGFQMARRYFELNSYTRNLFSLFHAITDHVKKWIYIQPSVQFKKLVMPLSDLKYSVQPFGNSQKINEQMINQGIFDAFDTKQQNLRFQDLQHLYKP